MHRPGMIAAVLYPQLLIGRETMNASETTKKVIDQLDRTLPCPFCGEGLYKTIYPNGVGYFSVVCDTCGGESGLGKTEAEAVDKWNKRA